MSTVHPSLAVIGPPPRLRPYLLESWFELLNVVRTPAFALPTLLFPLVFYVLFALVLPGQWSGMHKASYLLATYGVFGVIGPALFGFGVGMAMDRQHGLLELKRVSPMPTGAYFAAKIAMSLAFALIVMSLLSAAAVGFGDVELSLGRWLLLVLVLMFGTLPFCALGLLIGSLVKGQSAVAIVNLVYLPMSVLSGLWMPMWVFPTVLQKIAVIWPTWHLSQLALGVIGQLQDVNYVMHIAVMLVMSLLFLALAALRLRQH